MCILLQEANKGDLHKSLSCFSGWGLNAAKLRTCPSKARWLGWSACICLFNTVGNTPGTSLQMREAWWVPPGTQSTTQLVRIRAVTGPGTAAPTQNRVQGGSL